MVQIFKGLDDRDSDNRGPTVKHFGVFIDAMTLSAL